MSLILVREIQRITEFEDENGNTSHIVIELDLINCKDLEEKAKQIDKENYSNKCFGIEYNYVHNEDKLYVLENGLFYIDNCGDKHFIECKNHHIRNITKATLFEFKKFLNNKEKYLENNNTEYSIV